MTASDGYDIKPGLDRVTVIPHYCSSASDWDSLGPEVRCRCGWEAPAMHSMGSQKLAQMINALIDHIEEAKP